MGPDADLRALVTRAWDEQHARPRDSHDWAREALKRAEAEGDAASKAWAHLTLGYYELRYAGMDEARGSLEAAKGLLDVLGDRRGAILASNGLARVRMVEGELEEAQAVFLANLADETGVLTTLDRFYTLNGIAGCLAALGDTPQALAYLFEALGELRTINARPQLATLLSNLGSELVAVGDYEEAQRILEEACALAVELEHPRLKLNVHANLAECLVHFGRAAEALPHARHVMQDPETPHLSSPEGNVYPTAALVFLRNDCLEEAEEAIAHAEAAAERHQSRIGRIGALLVRAMALARRGETDAAIARLEEARAYFDKRTPHFAQCQVLELIAELSAGAGRHAQAFALHREFFKAYERRLGIATRARIHATKIHYELSRTREERDRAREQAVRDPLTGLYNRRYLDSVLGDLVSLFARTHQPLAVAMIDLDRFKETNDRHGHPFGDEVLKTLSRVLADGTRAGDITCRYGGEEFCLVFPNSTAEDALARIEDLLVTMRGTTVALAGVEVTGIAFSAGVAGFPGDGEIPKALIEAADRALYGAKRAGRARAFLHTRV